MTYELNFLFDRWIDQKPYPNLMPLADLGNGYVDVGQQYPFVVPLRLFYYSADHRFPLQCFDLQSTLPDVCFYPVALGFFNFDIDYFALMSAQVMELIRARKIKVLFYYHEGDNPKHEQQRLNDLCKQHSLSIDCYRFVSGNTAAKQVSNFLYFPDHELFYWRANKKQMALAWNEAPRFKQCTALSRTHKWWRATVMADLHRKGYLEHSFWSYNLLDVSDQPTDNPIETVWFPGLDTAIEQFLQNAPYRCDDLTEEQHNRHHTLVPAHFQESYFNIVLETMFDADQSGGTFLTEKTFKPIKHAQPFVLFAPKDSLTTLRELGYKTFDSQIMNYYDTIEDNTQRYLHVQAAVHSLLSQDLYRWVQSCKQDALHNQQMFLTSKFPRLNNLAKLLYESIN